MKTIGVIGLGSIGKRHAKNILDLGHKAVAFDPDPQAFKGADERVLSRGREWIYENCDGIVLALPTAEHASAIIDAPLHIPLLVEKPIGADETDLEYLRDFLKNNRNAPLVVGNNLRFHSVVEEVHQIISGGVGGDMGPVLWADFVVAQRNTKYTEDVILNWGAHEIDLARYLLGPIRVVAGVGSNKICNLILENDNGIHATVRLDYVTHPELRGFFICFESGQIACNLVDRMIVTRTQDGHVMKKLLGSFDNDYVLEMLAFLDLIDGDRDPRLATFEDGLEVLDIIVQGTNMMRGSK